MRAGKNCVQQRMQRMQQRLLEEAPGDGLRVGHEVGGVFGRGLGNEQRLLLDFLLNHLS